jgi:hypothetical protein
LDGNPLHDIRVDMVRTGVHPAEAFAFTDANGEAVFWVGELPNAKAVGLPGPSVH